MLSTCRKDNALNAENQMFRLRCTSCPAEASSIFSPLLWRASPRRPGSSVPPIVSESLRGDAQHGILSDAQPRSEEHTSELQSRGHLVCRLLLEKKKKKKIKTQIVNT